MHPSEEVSERIRLRPTAEADLPFVVELEHDPANTPFVGQWSIGEHKAALTNPDIGHWIIESDDDGAPLGYVIALGLTSNKHEIYLKRIVVAHEGRGIGRKALRVFHHMALRELGAGRIRLVVRRNNERARKFYLREGYKEIGALLKNKNAIMGLDLENV